MLRMIGCEDVEPTVLVVTVTCDTLSWVDSDVSVAPEMSIAGWSGGSTFGVTATVTNSLKPTLLIEMATNRY